MIDKSALKVEGMAERETKPVLHFPSRRSVDRGHYSSDSGVGIFPTYPTGEGFHREVTCHSPERTEKKRAKPAGRLRALRRRRSAVRALTVGETPFVSLTPSTPACSCAERFLPSAPFVTRSFCIRRPGPSRPAPATLRPSSSLRQSRSTPPPAPTRPWLPSPTPP